MQTKRQTNYELLRIIAMLMIIALHFNNSSAGGILGHLTFNTFDWYFFNILEILCIIAVNIYVLISGYFMCENKFKLSKFLKLELETIFYTLTIYIILCAFDKVTFNFKDLIKNFLPIMTRKYWYVSAYMELYMLSSIINILIGKMSKRQYQYLLIVLFIILSLLPTIYPNNNISGVLEGYSLIWFVYLYLIAGYLRLHYNNKFSNKKILLIYLSSIIIQIIIKIILSKLSNYSFARNYKNSLLNYNNIFILIESISLFLLFTKIKIENKFLNKIIMFFSSSTFAVYLIHSQRELSKLLWKTIKPYKYLENYKVYIILILTIIGIFTVSVLIDKIRIGIFKLVRKTKISNKIENKVNKINNLLANYI